ERRAPPGRDGQTAMQAAGLGDGDGDGVGVGRNGGGNSGGHDALPWQCGAVTPAAPASRQRVARVIRPSAIITPAVISGSLRRRRASSGPPNASRPVIAGTVPSQNTAMTAAPVHGLPVPDA